VRDVDRNAAIRRRVDAGVARVDAAGAPADPRTLQPTLPEATAAAVLKALHPAPEGGSSPHARSGTRSIPRPDDRIRRHRLAQRVVEQIQSMSPSSERGSIK
jgi:hypothetical protein